MTLRSVPSSERFGNVSERKKRVRKRFAENVIGTTNGKTNGAKETTTFGTAAERKNIRINIRKGVALEKEHDAFSVYGPIEQRSQPHMNEALVKGKIITLKKKIPIFDIYNVDKLVHCERLTTRDY